MSFSELNNKQDSVKDFFVNAFASNKLVNAYLFLGDADLDKYSFALEITKTLNCDAYKKISKAGNFEEFRNKSDKISCGKCMNCKWIDEKTHPMTPLYLEPDEDSKKGIINVESVKKLQSELARSSEYYRVVIISDASYSTLNKHSANALLKVLEEPSKNTMFIMFARDKDSVMPTIFSRAQSVNFNSNPSKTGSESAQEIYDLYFKRFFDSIENGHYRSSRLEAINLSEELSQHDPKTLVEFLEYLEDEYGSRVTGEVDNDEWDCINANRILACENAKGDLKSFVRPRTALEQMLLKL